MSFIDIFNDLYIFPSIVISGNFFSRANPINNKSCKNFLYCLFILLINIYIKSKFIVLEKSNIFINLSFVKFE